MRGESPSTFKDWLADALEDSGATKRGLARRMAEKHPRGVTQDTIESSRRTLRKIIAGKQTPTQPTRDSIQDALGRHDAPTVEDENADGPTTSEARALLRDMRRQMRLLERSLGSAN